MKLAQACVDVFSVGKTEASKFAGAIVQVFQEARGKLKGYKTGEKLSQPFKRICEKMLELSCTGDENVEDSQSQSLKALPVASSSFSTQEGPRRTLKEQLSIQSISSASTFLGKVKASRAREKSSSSSCLDSKSRAFLEGKIDVSLVKVVVQSSSTNVATSQEKEKWKQWLDRSTGIFKRIRPDGVVQNASTTPGPNGFVVASFDDGEDFETEVPNLFLEKMQAPVSKRPAANLKRPAASVKSQESRSKAAKTEEQPSVEQKTAEAPVDSVRSYTIMKYKESPPSRNHASFAIRRAFGDKKQIVQKSAKDIGEAKALEIVEQGKKRLAEGRSEQAVIDWIRKMPEN